MAPPATGWIHGHDRVVMRAVARACLRELHRTGYTLTSLEAAYAAWRACHPTSSLPRDEIRVEVGRIVTLIATRYRDWWMRQIEGAPFDWTRSDPNFAEKAARRQDPTHWVW